MLSSRVKLFIFPMDQTLKQSYEAPSVEVVGLKTEQAILVLSSIKPDYEPELW